MPHVVEEGRAAADRGHELPAGRGERQGVEIHAVHLVRRRKMAGHLVAVRAEVGAAVGGVGRHYGIAHPSRGRGALIGGELGRVGVELG